MKKSGFVWVLGCLLATAAMGQPATDYWEKVEGIEITAGAPGALTNVILASDSKGLVYAATWDGFFQSRNHGETWDMVALPDDRGDGWSSALLVLPDGRAWAAVGYRIYFSNDGETWEEYPAQIPSIYPSDLIYNQQDNVFFAGSELGIYRYIQETETWEQVSPIETELWDHDFEVGGVRLALSQDGNLFSADYSSAFVYRTEDQGSSWTRFDDGLPTQEEQGIAWNVPIDLVVDGTGTLFYSLYATDGGASPKTSATEGYGTFRSKDNGETWERINGLFPCSANCQETIDKAFTVSDGKVFSAISDGQSIRIVSSEDSGDTWHDVGFALEGESGPTALEIDADGYAYIGLGSGEVYRSTQPAVVTATEEAELPRSSLLHASYPNPVRTQTTIMYEVQEPGPVRLRLFNLLGQEVATLVNAAMPTGTHEYRLDAAGLPAGVYVYRLETGSARESQFLIRVR